MTIARLTIAFFFCTGAIAGPAQAEQRNVAIIATNSPSELPAPVRRADLRDGSHDFDFEFGTWKAHVARRLHPLTGSTDWVTFDGISTVAKIWNGAANLGELRVVGPSGEVRGLSLRLYDPASREWKISWANSQDGVLTAPMVGSFDGKGGGEFHNADTLGGRQILARFIFSGTTGKNFRIEQSFSADTGRTWEANWIADFSR